MKELKNKKVSQLDYLWANFGDLKVSGDLSRTPDTNILTEKAILNLINNSLGSALISLDCLENIYNPAFWTIKGTTSDGKTLDLFTLPKREKIKEIEITSDGFNIITEPGYSYTAKLNGEIVTKVLGSNTILLVLKDGVLTTELRINPTSPVKLTATNEGLNAVIPIKSIAGEDLKDFKLIDCTLAEYKALPYVDSGTFYYLTDKRYFYYNNILYGYDIIYDEESDKFSIDGRTIKADDSDLYWVSL